MKQITHLHPLPKLSPWVRLILSLPLYACLACTDRDHLAIQYVPQCCKWALHCKSKTNLCLCSLHLFVRWSIRKKFLPYIFINTVYFIPVYSRIHVDVWSKVEGSFIYCQNQETSVIIRCVQKTTAECSIIFACVLKTTVEWWMCKLGNAHILSLLFYTMLKNMFSFKNFHPSTHLVTDAPDMCRHEVWLHIVSITFAWLQPKLLANFY